MGERGRQASRQRRRRAPTPPPRGGGPRGSCHRRLVCEESHNVRRQIAADAGMLGSMDANRGDYQNGWGTDQFPTNINELVESMLIIIEAGGFQGGGINFDAKRRRNSTDAADLFHAHIGGIDAFARALITADSILQKSEYKKIRSNRYASFDAGKGKDFEQGKLTLEDLRNFAIENGEPKTTSGQQEYLENIINRFI